MLLAMLGVRAASNSPSVVVGKYSNLALYRKCRQAAGHLWDEMAEMRSLGEASVIIAQKLSTRLLGVLAARLRTTGVDGAPIRKVARCRAGSTFLSIALLGMAAFSMPASATPLTFNFTGIVIENSAGLLFTGKSVGDTYSGSFTVDNPPTASFSGTGVEVYNSGFTLEIEGFNAFVFQVEYSYDNPSVPDGIEIYFNSGGALTLRSSADIFTSAAFPTNFNFSDFDDIAQVNLADPSNISPNVDRGSITAPVEPVALAETGTLAVLCLGLVGLGLARRNRAA